MPSPSVRVKSKLKYVMDRVVDYVLDADAHNIHRAMQRRALEDTCAFVEENLFLAPCFPSKNALLAAALDAVKAPGGLYCEFGVYSGNSINFIARRVASTIYGFDSFQGLPEDWRPEVSKGHFASRLPRVESNVELVVGWFDQSLPPFLEKHAGPASFLHVDSDLYSSARTIFDAMGDRIVPGTVIAFDEYFNYPRWREGEHRAFLELVERQKLQFEYIGYVQAPPGRRRLETNEQVAVRITPALS